MIKNHTKLWNKFVPKTSYQILKAVYNNNNLMGVTYSQLMRETKIAQASIYNYLKFFVNKKILQVNKKGKNKFYFLTDDGKKIAKKIFELEKLTRKYI